MALPAQPGAPSPTPTPRPVSPGTSTGDYLTNEVNKLAMMNQSQPFDVKSIKDYVSGIRDVIVASEI